MSPVQVTKSAGNACRRTRQLCRMRPTRFPPPGLVRSRSAARPLTGLMAPLTGGRPRFRAGCNGRGNVHVAWSALERLEGSAQRAGGDQQLPLGLVDRGDNILPVGAE